MTERDSQRGDSRFRDDLIRQAHAYKQERLEAGMSEKTIANDMIAITRFIAFLCDEPR